MPGASQPSVNQSAKVTPGEEAFGLTDLANQPSDIGGLFNQNGQPPNQGGSVVPSDPLIPNPPFGGYTGNAIQTAYDFFVSKGLTGAQAAGIIGNLMQESGVNPESVQQGGPGRGIAQWSVGGRWQPSMMTGNVGADLITQLNYIWHELTTTESASLAALKATNTAQAAAMAISQYYERPAAAYANNTGREANAASVLTMATSGNWNTPTGGAVAGGAATGAAGTGGGGLGSAGTAGTAPAQLTIGQETVALVQQNYPQLAWMLTIPDIASDIKTWAATNYTTDEITTRLAGQPWYQRLGPSFFTWIAAQATNPGQAAQTFQEELDSVKQTFAQLGLKPSPQQLQTFAYQALAQDWANHPELEQAAIAGTVAANPNGTFSVRNFVTGPTGQMTSTFIGPQGEVAKVQSGDFQTSLPANYVTNGLVTQIGSVGQGGKVGPTDNITPGAPVYAMVGGQLVQNYDKTKLAPGTALYTLPNYVVATPGEGATGAPSTVAGSLQNAEQVFRQTAADYMVPISDASAAQLVQQALQSGTTDIATFAKTYFEAQAKSLYPTMAAAIDAGITPKAYAAPYQQVVANLLGVSADSVNMLDPKYMRFVTQKDPKTGMPTAMSLYDAQQLVMSDPTYGYMKTTNASDRASALAQGIGEMFGKTSAVPSGFSGVQAPRP